MKLSRLICCIALLASGGAAQAQVAPPATTQGSVTVEYYYRIRWGSAEEFSQLYDRNHAPLLAEMQKLGFIRSIRVQAPTTHLAGGPRWDLRVTVVYRDAAAAIADPEFDKQWGIARDRLYKDRKQFESEEKTRFSLLEEHWDVIVADVVP